MMTNADKLLVIILVSYSHVLKVVPLQSTRPGGAHGFATAYANMGHSF